MMISHGLVASWIVIALVQAQVVRSLWRAIEPLDNDCCECFGQQLGIMTIGTRNDDGEWTTLAFGQDAPF